MLTASAVVFGLAALGGFALAGLHFRKKNLPVPLAIGHGLLAATGLVLLIAAVVAGGMSKLLGIALGLFVAAALGGFFLFALHLRKRPLSTSVVVIHALAAASGLALLLSALLQASS